MAKEILDSIQSPSLFDCYERTDRSGGRSTESAFEFFNRSAWRSAEIARNTLESWFSNIPQTKKADLRGRFRGDDRRHSTALLELATHEILRAVAEDVQVEPDICGGRPDFSAVYRDTRLIVECTVAQESDSKFGALQRERAVLDAINSIRPGPFRLKLEPRSVGESQPSLSKLQRFLETWLASLSPQSHSTSSQVGFPFEPTVWQWQDWVLHFEAIPLGSAVEGGTLGVTVSQAQHIVDDLIIARALKKKAEKYIHPQAPYLIVVAQRESLAEETVILDTLLGPENWLISRYDASIGPRQFDGFFGSRLRPRRRHVSAVLYKRSMRDAWSICGQRTTYDPYDSTPRPVPEWHIVHNPFATVRLPQGMFPFATEHVWLSGNLTPINPMRTLNDVLGLPDPWPGEEH